MRPIGKLLVATLCLFAACTAQAGTDWYVRFVNRTSEPIPLRFGGEHGWHPDEFRDDHVVPARGSLELHTEDVGSKPGICGVDVPFGAFGGSHIEVWQYRHWHSVQQNISTAPAPVHGFLSKALFCRANMWICLSFFGIGTNNPRITTSIESSNQGLFFAVHARVTFQQ